MNIETHILEALSRMTIKVSKGRLWFVEKKDILICLDCNSLYIKRDFLRVLKSPTNIKEQVSDVLKKQFQLNFKYVIYVDFVPFQDDVHILQF